MNITKKWQGSDKNTTTNNKIFSNTGHNKSTKNNKVLISVPSKVQNLAAQICNHFFQTEKGKFY